MRFASGQSELRHTAEQATSYTLTLVDPVAPRLSDDPDCKAIHEYGDGFELMVLNLLLGMVMGMAQPIHCSACFMKVIVMVMGMVLSSFVMVIVDGGG